VDPVDDGKPEVGRKGSVSIKRDEAARKRRHHIIALALIVIGVALAWWLGVNGTGGAELNLGRTKMYSIGGKSSLPESKETLSELQKGMRAQTELLELLRVSRPICPLFIVINEAKDAISAMRTAISARSHPTKAV